MEGEGEHGADPVHDPRLRHLDRRQVQQPEQAAAAAAAAGAKKSCQRTKRRVLRAFGYLVAKSVWWLGVGWLWRCDLSSMVRPRNSTACCLKYGLHTHTTPRSAPVSSRRTGTVCALGCWHARTNCGGDMHVGAASFCCSQDAGDQHPLGAVLLQNLMRTHNNNNTPPRGDQRTVPWSLHAVLLYCCTAACCTAVLLQCRVLYCCSTDGGRPPCSWKGTERQLKVKERQWNVKERQW